MITSKQRGFSLLESLVAVAVTSVGFAGVYALVNASRGMIDNSFERQELSFIASEMLEAVAANVQEIDGFEQSFNDCTVLASNIKNVLSDQNQALMINWCARLVGELGESTAASKRDLKIGSVTNSSGITFKVVRVQLSDAEGKTQVATKRVIYAP